MFFRYFFTNFFSYYRRAADNPDRPHPKAACRIASMLYSGANKGESIINETSLDKTKRLASALSYYKKAAKLGDAEAENALGIMIEELGDVSSSNQEEKKEEKGDFSSTDSNSDRAGDSSSVQFLGGDPASAGLWYRRAAFNGNPYALLNLARLYSTGKGVDRNLPYAAKLLRQASAAGVVQADIELAQLEKDMATGEDRPSRNSPHRLTTSLDAARPDVPVRVVTEEERKSKSPKRRNGEENYNNNKIKTPERNIAIGSSNNNNIRSPFTQKAEASLALLRELLVDE